MLKSTDLRPTTGAVSPVQSFAVVKHCVRLLHPGLAKQTSLFAEHFDIHK